MLSMGRNLKSRGQPEPGRGESIWRCTWEPEQELEEGGLGSQRRIHPVLQSILQKGRGVSSGKHLPYNHHSRGMLKTQVTPRVTLPLLFPHELSMDSNNWHPRWWLVTYFLIDFLSCFSEQLG